MLNSGLYYMILYLWNAVNIPFTYYGITFTFWDVIKAGIILTLIGLFIGKIIFFFNNRR